MKGNPEVEARLQPQRGLVLPNAVVLTNSSLIVREQKAHLDEPIIAD